MSAGASTSIAISGSAGGSPAAASASARRSSASSSRFIPCEEEVAGPLRQLHLVLLVVRPLEEREVARGLEEAAEEDLLHLLR